ncbi:unnamed protein product [Meloidogyne enterolobii]|uniref:Uncharacterized protein n=1 Tax=Meloidogyne enterolobii TaxID=390850 RepID=A0ACB0XT97_MELEN
MTLGEQIVRLLENRNGQQEESTSLRDQIQKAINNSMANANPFEFGPHTEQQWKSRLTATERALGPYIELLLPELRERILESGGNGGAMGDERELIIDELHRFRHFLARKPVKDKLQAERQTLFARLYDEMNSQQHNFERLLSASNLPTGRFLTEIAAKIYALRAQRSQVDKLQKAGVAFFEDLPNYERFEQTLKELSEQLIAAEQEQFDAWCRDMIAHIVDGGVNDGDSISLQTTGRLMVLERARGILTVSFSDRLARLLREVSQLQSMGFKVPVKILACVQQGERFYEYGVLLKQVAHFYNTIEKQMLPCQQAMLLDEALAFEQLVVPSSKSGGDRKQKTAVNLTWESPEKLKGYIERLREAALQLTSHNRSDKI